jgi:hypothetical protein
LVRSFNPIRVGAAALAPLTHGVTTILDQGIATTFAYLRRARLHTFRSELVSLGIELTEEEVRSREFVEALVAAASRVENTKREEKIALFARLLKSYWRGHTFTAESYDEYEEDLTLVDEISYREFKILSILHRMEQEHPMYSGMNRLQRARTFWSDFEKEASQAIGVEPTEFEGYLQRLSRTGLYQPITGTYLSYEGGLGYSTQRFDKLKGRLNSDNKAVSQLAS